MRQTTCAIEFIAKHAMKLIKRRSKYVGVLVGYERGNSYRIFVPAQNKIVVSRDVSFHESPTPPISDVKVHGSENAVTDIFSRSANDCEAESTSSANNDVWEQAEDVATGDSQVQQELQMVTDSLTRFPNLQRSGCISHPSDRCAALLTMHSRDGDIDSSTSPSPVEATEWSEHNEWKRGMVDEMDSIEENCTWKLVPKPAHIKSTSTCWVYPRNRDANGSITRYKARIVANCYSQNRGID